MIAHVFGLYDLEFLLGKWLSVKVLINKEVFGIADEFLMRCEFDFFGCEVDEMVDFSGF